MTRPKYPTQAELMEVFEYIDDEIYLKEYVDRRGCHRKRRIIRNVANNGSYCMVNFKGKRIYYHTLSKILRHGDSEPGKIIDHVEGDTLDNNPDNLMWKTPRENVQNKRRHREGKLPGTTFCKRCDKFLGQIWFEGGKRHLGYYDTELEAFDAYIHFHQENSLPLQHLQKLRIEYIKRSAA